MAAFPSEIPGFGSSLQAPRQDPGFSPGADFTTEDYFVFSRCDGHATARDIVLMVGLGVDKGCSIMGKLRRLGAILLPGETPEQAAAARAAPGRADTSPRRAVPDGSVRGRPVSAPMVSTDGRPARTRAGTAQLGELSPEEAAAMREDVALGPRERERVLEVRRQVTNASLYDLLDVIPTTDRKELKRAYFRLSKEFHPDRYYRKPLGSFAPWLTQIFEAVTRAFEVLDDERQRAAYDARLRGEAPVARPAAVQSRAEHAAELFDRACTLEHRGALAEAIRMFGAAIRAEPLPRYLRRAARCCLAGDELALAEEYARKGAELRPTDPAYVRVLAEVQRAASKLAEAEATLVRALALDTDNDVLVGELRADLAAVRAARRGGG